MTVTTLDTVKAVLGIHNDQKDAQITALIPLVEEYMRNECNDPYLLGFPPGYELIAIKMIEYNLNQQAGVASKSLSRYSVSFSTDYPASITKGLKRKLRW